MFSVLIFEIVFFLFCEQLALKVFFMQVFWKKDPTTEHVLIWKSQPQHDHSEVAMSLECLLPMCALFSACGFPPDAHFGRAQEMCTGIAGKIIGKSRSFLHRIFPRHFFKTWGDLYTFFDLTFGTSKPKFRAGFGERIFENQVFWNYPILLLKSSLFTPFKTAKPSSLTNLIRLCCQKSFPRPLVRNGSPAQSPRRWLPPPLVARRPTPAPSAAERCLPSGWHSTSGPGFFLRKVAPLSTPQPRG